MFYFALLLAGGSGTLCRYFINRLTVNLNWATLPLGTLIVNVLGSLLMGYLSWMIVQKWQLSKELQTVVLTGFLGGFTTFSAFSLETITMVEEGSLGWAFFYLLISVSLCLLMCFLGLWLARHS